MRRCVHFGTKVVTSSRQGFISFAEAQTGSPCLILVDLISMEAQHLISLFLIHPK